MFLHLHMMVRNELACYAVNPDGSDGCRVGFASREYAAGPNGKRFAGVLVRLVVVYTPNRENRAACQLYHHNHDDTVAEVVQFSTDNN